MRLDALVINLNRFGDLLLSQPLLHDLHKAGRSTTLLCLEKYADTEGLLQFASPLLTVPDHLVSPEQADATRHELQAWAENLRATVQADHIINLTPSMPARLLATALAPAPEAVLGFGLDHKGRPRVDGLWPAFLHAAELRQSNAPFNLADMFRMTGAPLLGGLSGRLLSQPGSGLLSELGTEARETARRLLAHAPVIRHGFIGMQLGASEKRRQWPVSHFVELGKRIWQEEGICPVLLGEASERPLADEYARLTSTPFVDVVGQTNIFELGAVLREMAMLVTNNTGTMHLAAGLGLPLLSIFLATAQPCDTGPYLPGSCCLEPTLPCHPCPHDHDCVLGEKCRHHISASIVADLVLAKLTSGQWSEGITTSACREARIWQTATDSRGFITTTCLSDHKADDRTLWLCQQRVYWRRILDDLTSGATGAHAPDQCAPEHGLPQLFQPVRGPRGQSPEPLRPPAPDPAAGMRPPAGELRSHGPPPVHDHPPAHAVLPGAGQHGLFLAPALPALPGPRPPLPPGRAPAARPYPALGQELRLRPVIGLCRGRGPFPKRALFHYLAEKKEATVT